MTDNIYLSTPLSHKYCVSCKTFIAQGCSFRKERGERTFISITCPLSITLPRCLHLLRTHTHTYNQVRDHLRRAWLCVCVYLCSDWMLVCAHRWQVNEINGCRRVCRPLLSVCRSVCVLNGHLGDTQNSIMSSPLAWHQIDLKHTHGAYHTAWGGFNHFLRSPGRWSVSANRLPQGLGRPGHPVPSFSFPG